MQFLIFTEIIKFKQFCCQKVEKYFFSNIFIFTCHYKIPSCLCYASMISYPVIFVIRNLALLKKQVYFLHDIKGKCRNSYRTVINIINSY